MWFYKQTIPVLDFIPTIDKCQIRIIKVNFDCVSTVTVWLAIIRNKYTKSFKNVNFNNDSYSYPSSGKYVQIF